MIRQFKDDFIEIKFKIEVGYIKSIDIEIHDKKLFQPLVSQSEEFRILTSLHGAIISILRSVVSRENQLTTIEFDEKNIKKLKNKCPKCGAEMVLVKASCAGCTNKIRCPECGFSAPVSNAFGMEIK